MKSRPTGSAPPPAAPAPVRRAILLVDDHPFMRAGLAQLIERQPDMLVCGEAGDPTGAFQELRKKKPDLVLTDLTMPGRSGLEFIKDLLAADSTVAVLVISMHDELVYAERVIRAGARGYIMKEAGGENLLAAIRQVLRGEVYVSPRISARILEGLSARRPRGSTSPIEKLSDREFEVFQLIGQGKSTRDIAGQLHLSPKTVDVHRSHIKEKLELKDATALIRHAVRWVETLRLGP
ncbi:MAG: response regulator transcription factor [Verrucomicrobia bacterium]|nr:response regulator transcription factor [Verrucomicrobiota bacterium]